MHHLKDITGTLGNELSRKKIALCATGSAAITEAPGLARLLMRHGAEVFPVLTPKAAEFVSPMVFEWSTGNAPITRLTGRVEHVEFVSSNRLDLVLIAPCTANTLSKIAHGISDEPVSTLACTALGAGIPILIASAMHEPMLQNPIIREARAKLEKVGVRFVDGKIVESKSKIAESEEILREVISIVGDKNSKSTGDLAGLGFLITAGATREPIDSVRYITNASSGKMGVALAEQALRRGAKKVCLVCGPAVDIPESFKMDQRIQLQKVKTTEEMLRCVLSELSNGDYEVMISAGAPADYAPVSPVSGKIDTTKNPEFNLRLKATEKIIARAKEKCPDTFVVAFKAEHSLGKAQLLRRAGESLKSSRADLVVANDVGRDGIGFGSDFNEVYIVSGKNTSKVKHLPKATKSEIASGILDSVLLELRAAGA